MLGALSPRTRNAQVALYQSGDVDFLVATDAIGMGLNLDVDHVAFAAIRKFDGQNHRNLTPAELGADRGPRRPAHERRHVRRDRDRRAVRQRSGRAAGDRTPSSRSRVLQWRNRTLDFGSLDRLRDSLREMPREQRPDAGAHGRRRAGAGERQPRTARSLALATGPATVARLWEVCQVPDYRKISSQNHAEMVGTLYKFLMSPTGRIPEDWFAKQVAFADRTDGDIDTLANRIAHIRTWTFVSNRPDWLKDPEHWQARTREIEDALSDALHERLTQRFVDRRTSALMRACATRKSSTPTSARTARSRSRITSSAASRASASGPTRRPTASTARRRATRRRRSFPRSSAMRARRVAAAKNDAFKVTRAGRVLWRDEEIATLDVGRRSAEAQRDAAGRRASERADKEKVQARLETWITDTIAERLKPLVDISKAEDISGLARGIAFRLTETFGVLKRDSVAEEIKSLDQEARAQLRKYGVRFGAFNIYFPLLLKPAPAELTLDAVVR